MAVKVVGSWANFSRGKNINTVVLKATSSTLPVKGSQIKVSDGVATAIVEGEDDLFYGVTLTDPAQNLRKDPTGTTYYVTVTKDPNAKFVFAVDTEDTFADYTVGDKVLIGDNCQTVKLATQQVTPGVYEFIGEVTDVWTMTDRSYAGYQFSKEIWDEIVDSISGTTPVFNFSIVEIQITGSIG